LKPKNASFSTSLLQIGQPQLALRNCLSRSIKELPQKKLGMQIAV
jgi:hypothetical protein